MRGGSSGYGLGVGAAGEGVEAAEVAEVGLGTAGVGRRGVNTFMEVLDVGRGEYGGGT